MIKQRIIHFFFIFAITCLCINATEEISNAQYNILKIVNDNLKYSEEENLEKYMQTVHPESPSFAGTKQQLPQVFSIYDFKYELVEFKFLLVDGEYGIVRIKQKTTLVKGPEFNNNIIDMIQIFKKKNETWKFWQQVILEVEYL